MSFIARFPGTCTECGDRIEPGDEVSRAAGAGGYSHVTCPDSIEGRDDRAALMQPRCGRCGLNHPGEC